jgi:hypothetical protein
MKVKDEDLKMRLIKEMRQLRITENTQGHMT